MVRFVGKVGYAIPTDRGGGVWTTEITERTYYGEVKKATVSVDDGEKVNPDIRLQHRISIVADPFALDNFMYLKYVEWAGHCWQTPNVELARPRLILSLGGVYNGKRPQQP